MANRAAGKGYENTEFYVNVEFQFLGIENIHVMRQSLQKLVYGKYMQRRINGALTNCKEYSDVVMI